jgi:hypothetical protein
MAPPPLSPSAEPEGIRARPRALGSHALDAILKGGLTAGALDLVFAVLLYHAKPAAVLKSIASGLLGAGAYGDGLATPALGLLLHFGIATTWSALYVIASSRMRVLVQRAIPSGLTYGVVVYFVMNYVVLPLSAVSFARPFHLGLLSNGVWLAGLAGHMLLIGLPIALFARRSSLLP